MSNVVRHYPPGFTQIYLDLFSGDKNPYEAAWYLCLECEAFNRSLV